MFMPLLDFEGTDKSFGDFVIFELVSQDARRFFPLAG
jgi:hypothetical protein